MHLRRQANAAGSNHPMQQVQRGMQNAAHHVGPAYSKALGVAGDGLTQARTWTAPRLHQAADMFESSVAPRISSMMTGAARKIEPARHRSRLPLIAGIIGAIAAVGGAVAVILTRRQSTIVVVEADGKSSDSTAGNASRSASDNASEGASEGAEETANGPTAMQEKKGQNGAADTVSELADRAGGQNGRAR